MKIQTDREIEIYNLGIKKGMEHTEPSKDTIRLIDEQKTASAIILERLKNIDNTLRKQQKQNEKEHKGISDRQDHTNGDIKALKLWRAGMLGAGAVITGAVVPLVIYLAHDAKNDLAKYYEIHQETVEKVEYLLSHVEKL